MDFQDAPKGVHKLFVMQGKIFFLLHKSQKIFFPAGRIFPEYSHFIKGIVFRIVKQD